MTRPLNCALTPASNNPPGFVPSHHVFFELSFILLSPNQRAKKKRFRHIFGGRNSSNNQKKSQKSRKEVVLKKKTEKGPPKQPEAWGKLCPPKKSLPIASGPGHTCILVVDSICWKLRGSVTPFTSSVNSVMATPADWPTPSAVRESLMFRMDVRTNCTSRSNHPACLAASATAAQWGGGGRQAGRRRAWPVQRAATLNKTQLRCGQDRNANGGTCAEGHHNLSAVMVKKMC